MATKTTKKKKSSNRSSGKKSAIKQNKSKKPLIIAIASVIIALCVAAAGIAAHFNVIPTPYEFKGDRVSGIDVSSHNGKIDWKKVSKQVDFAFIRVGCRGYGNGKIFLDERAKYNMKHAQKAGVPFGVYIYSQAVNEEEAVEEAEFLLKHIKGYNVQLPLVFDFEYAYKDGKMVGRLAEADLNKKSRTAMINAFCKTVIDAGYTPALYASTYIYKLQINPSKLEKGTVIWVADYNEKITYGGDYDIWQYTCTGKMDGVGSKYVDKDYWYTNEKDKD